MTEERFDHIYDVYERLANDARRCLVPARLLDIKSEKDLLEARELVDNVINQGIISARQLARRANQSPSAISAFRNCHKKKWKGSVQTLHTMASDLVRAVELFLKQREAEETFVTGCVETRFVEEVRSVVNYAVRFQKIAVFVAPAGAGKSTVLNVIYQEIPGAVLVTISQTSATTRGFLQTWARAMGLHEHGQPKAIKDRIVDCLLGSGRLVMIDEAHKLGSDPLNVMREIWDEVRVPLVLAGTPSFYQTLHGRRVGANATELLDQLASRISMKRDLTVIEGSKDGEPDQLFTVEDIRKVFNRGKMRLVDGADDLLCQIANMPGKGCLRTCADLVEKASEIFKTKAIDREQLFQALVVREGLRGARYVMDQAGVSERKAVAVAG